MVVGGFKANFVSGKHLVLKRSRRTFWRLLSPLQAFSKRLSVLHVSFEGAPSELHSARRQATKTCTATVHVLFTYLGDSCHTPVIILTLRGTCTATVHVLFVYLGDIYKRISLSHILALTGLLVLFMQQCA